MLQNNEKALPDTYKAFLQVCDCPSYVPEELVPSQKPIHIFYSLLRKENITHLKPSFSINLRKSAKYAYRVK